MSFSNLTGGVKEVHVMHSKAGFGWALARP